MEVESCGDGSVEGDKVEVVPPQCVSNDSGYSSDLFSSPEPPAGRQLCHSSSAPSLTPALSRTHTRLSSTPHSSSRTSVPSFCLPKCSSFDSLTTSQEISGCSTASIPAVHDQCKLEVTYSEQSSSTQGESLICDSKAEAKSPDKKQILSPRKTLLSRILSRRRKPQAVFVRLLGEAEYLVYRVLRYLPPQDLVRVSQVNRQLRAIICKDKQLNLTRNTYFGTRKAECEHKGKENFTQKKPNDESSSQLSARLSPRKELSSIQNLQPTSPKKQPTPVYGISTLADKFREEGQKLSKGEQLQKCVKCKSPATVFKDQQRATCKTCHYDYCTRCHLPVHRKAQDCPVSKPRTRQASGIFSSRAKRNLRRL